MEWEHIDRFALSCVSGSMQKPGDRRFSPSHIDCVLPRTLNANRFKEVHHEDVLRKILPKYRVGHGHQDLRLLLCDLRRKSLGEALMGSAVPFNQRDIPAKGCRE